MPVAAGKVRVLLYCHGGAAHRAALAREVADRASAGWAARVPFDHVCGCLEVTAPAAEAGTLDLWASALDRRAGEPQVGVFVDHDHPRSGRGRYRPRLAKHPDWASMFAARPAVATAAATACRPAAAATLAPPYGHTAAAMAAYYGYPTAFAGDTAPEIAIISLGGGLCASDVQTYFQTVLGQSGSRLSTVSWVNVDQTTTPAFTASDSDLENTLDVELAGGMCPGARVTVLSAPNSDTGFMLALATAIQRAPQVISISWGSAESEYPASSLASLSDLCAQAAAAGITVCVAAGDDGSNDSVTNARGQSDGKLHVDFPASSPHVVACGGTTLPIPGATEVAWSLGGGGLSAVFAQPAFQAGVVAFPKSGAAQSLAGRRGVPDVALNANPQTGWTILFAGQLGRNAIGGTSCVAPAVAAYVALLGLRFVVDLNTAMYAVYRNAAERARCFRDIVLGSNDTVPGVPNVFKAGPGYDFCTGLGCLVGTALAGALVSVGNAVPRSAAVASTPIDASAAAADPAPTAASAPSPPAAAAPSPPSPAKSVPASKPALVVPWPGGVLSRLPRGGYRLEYVI